MIKLIALVAAIAALCWFFNGVGTNLQAKAVERSVSALMAAGECPDVATCVELFFSSTN